MTSKTSKSIPLIVLIATFSLIAIEGYLGLDFGLESFMPLLMAMGLGGGAIKVAKEVTAMKKSIPVETQTAIRAEVSKIMKKDHNL